MARRAVAICVLSLSASATAANTTAVAIATGDCKDAELLTGATGFSDAVAGQLKGAAVEPGAALDKLRPRPTAGLDEVQRQLDGAQSLFYGGEYDKAIEQVRSAIRSLERLMPVDPVVKQLISARVLEGLISKAQNKKSEQLDAWRRVLRVLPEHQLDPDYHTPAAIAQFEALKREVAKARRVAVSVTSTPPGATVFLDAVPIGKTPLTSTGFVAGDYKLTLVLSGAQSFVHEVKLSDKPFELQVDLAFETSVRPSLPLCVTSGDLDALKLATRVGADQALLMHNSEPGWVSAVLYDVGRGMRVREGGMKVAAARKDNGWADLASFVLTGQPATLAVNRAMENGAAPAPAASPPAAEVTATRSSGSNLPRIIAASVIGAGVVVAAVGIGVFATGAKDRADLSDALTVDHEVRPNFDADQVALVDAKVRSNRNLSLGLGVTGLALAAAGTVLFFVLGPRGAAVVSAFVTPQGAYAGVTGSF